MKIILLILLIIGLAFVGCTMVLGKYDAEFIAENSDEIVRALLESIHNGEFKQSLMEDADTELKSAVENHYDACVENKYSDTMLPNLSEFEGMEKMEKMIIWLTENIFMEILTCITDKAGIPLPE